MFPLHRLFFCFPAYTCVNMKLFEIQFCHITMHYIGIRKSRLSLSSSDAGNCCL